MSAQSQIHVLFDALVDFKHLQYASHGNSPDTIVKLIACGSGCQAIEKNGQTLICTVDFFCVGRSTELPWRLLVLDSRLSQLVLEQRNPLVGVLFGPTTGARIVSDPSQAAISRQRPDSQSCVHGFR